MSSDNSVDVRAVVFVNGTVEKSFDGLPTDVREAAEVAITALQNNRPLPSKKASSLKGSLAGITEIKLPYDSDTYRVYNLVEYEEVIYVLDAGIKKSKEGSEIPRDQVETLIARKKAAEDLYSRDIEAIRKAYVERKSRREQAGKAPKPRGV